MKVVFKTKASGYIITLIIGLLVASVPLYYFFDKYQNSQKNDPQQITQKIKELVEFPQDENPLITTISNSTPSSESSRFFKSWQIGDKILIYEKSQKAILYRPENEKVVEVVAIDAIENKDVAGVTTNAQVQSNPSPSASLSTSLEFKVALYNGTKTSGLAAKTETQIKKTFPKLQVTEKSNSKKDYQKTLVVVINDLQKDVGFKLASDLNAETGSLPDGEKKPQGADILIILGEDRL